MLPIVIASSILALILLTAALAELFCRWVIEFFVKRATSRPASMPYEDDDRFGMLADPNQLQIH